MCEKNIDWLLAACPQPRMWPETQARALTRNLNWRPFGLQDDAQPTESQQSRQPNGIQIEKRASRELSSQLNVS